MAPSTSSRGAAASQRACLRCIAKKRRCDHEHPVCGSCGKLKVSCEYPPPQSRRGPVPGLSKRAEWRVQQCENALWFLLNVPGVTAAVRQAAADGVLPGNMQLGEPSTAARAGSEDVEGALPQAPTASLGRETRAEWWSTHRLDTAGDILDFERACRQLVGENGDAFTVTGGTATGAAAERAAEAQDMHARAPAALDAPRPTSSARASTRPSTAASPVLAPTGSAALAAPVGVSATPPPIYTPASSSLRNSMGPSLWQLVTAAIPDSESAGFQRELQELRTRRERAVTEAGAEEGVRGRERERERERDRERDQERDYTRGDKEREHAPDHAPRPTSEEHNESENEAQAAEQRKREQARAQLALFEAAIAEDNEEQRVMDKRRKWEKEERAKASAAAALAPTAAGDAGAGGKEPTGTGTGTGAGADDDSGTGTDTGTNPDDRFNGLRLPLGVLPNEHLTWTSYGTGAGAGAGPGVGGMGSVTGTGAKRRRLEDMFWGS